MKAATEAASLFAAGSFTVLAARASLRARVEGVADADRRADVGRPVGQIAD